MTDREDRFADELDALTHGEPIPDADDLARFAAEARAVWAHDAAPPSGVPLRLIVSERRRLWESIRQEATVSRSSHEGSTVMSGHTLAAPVTTSRPTGWGATVARWQPVLSIAVMFALLFGLVGIAYTGLNRRNDDPSPTAAGLIAQGTPVAEVECELYGPPVRTSSELRDMSLSDWPVRDYTPVAVALPMMGRLAVEVYENWVTCAWVFADESSVSPPPEEILRYWSDRMQYVFMLQRNQSFASEELAEFLQQPSIETLLLHGALPLNRPSVEIEIPGTGESFPSFLPGDVYELSDGRYGVVIGTISTEQLVGSQSDAVEDEAEKGVWLTFLAFVEADGYLLIDEYLSFCVPTPALPYYGTADIAACESALVGSD